MNSIGANFYRIGPGFAVTLAALLLIAFPARSQEVIRTDGTAYVGVEHLKVFDDFVVFDHDGQSYSLNKRRVAKVLDAKGRVIYEHLDLSATLVNDENNNPIYLFYRNGLEVGRGKWLDAGEFKVLRGNIPDGEYKLMHDTGELKRSFSFKNGNLNGVCKVFFRSGQVEREGVFKDGREEGESKLYYHNGVLKGVSIYKRGRKNGPTTLYYPSGKIRSKLNFKDSKPDGTQTMFFENGKTESIVNYDNGMPNGKVKFFFENGKLKMEGKFVNGALDGLVTTYYESGRVKKRKRFVNGRVIE